MDFVALFLLDATFLTIVDAVVASMPAMKLRMA